MQQTQLRGIGDIDQRSAVVFMGARQRIQRAAVMMADISHPATVLLMDDGLIGAAPLQVMKTDQRHVTCFRQLRCVDSGSAGQAKNQQGIADCRQPHQIPGVTCFQ